MLLYLTKKDSKVNYSFQIRKPHTSNYVYFSDNLLMQEKQRKVIKSEKWATSLKLPTAKAPAYCKVTRH